MRRRGARARVEHAAHDLADHVRRERLEIGVRGWPFAASRYHPENRSTLIRAPPEAARLPAERRRRNIERAFFHDGDDERRK